MDGYELVKWLRYIMGMRFWNSCSESRQQKADESLQIFEVDAGRLVHFTCPTIPENTMKCQAVQMFVNGIKTYTLAIV